MTVTATLAAPAPPAADCPSWCHPDACFGDGFHASETLGPDQSSITLYQDDERTWLSVNHGDVYLPQMTMAEARELAAAILELADSARRQSPTPRGRYRRTR